MAALRQAKMPHILQDEADVANDDGNNAIIAHVTAHLPRFQEVTQRIGFVPQTMVLQSQVAGMAQYGGLIAEPFIDLLGLVVKAEGGRKILAIGVHIAQAGKMIGDCFRNFECAAGLQRRFEPLLRRIEVTHCQINNADRRFTVSHCRAVPQLLGDCLRGIEQFQRLVIFPLQFIFNSLKSF